MNILLNRKEISWIVDNFISDISLDDAITIGDMAYKISQGNYGVNCDIDILKRILEYALTLNNINDIFYSICHKIEMVKKSKKDNKYGIIFTDENKIKSIKTLREIMRVNIVKSLQGVNDGLRYCKHFVENSVVLGPFSGKQLDIIKNYLSDSSCGYKIVSVTKTMYTIDKFFNDYHKDA